MCDNSKIELQSISCSCCGNYIEIFASFDFERKIENIYCNNLKHHEIIYRLVKLAHIRDIMSIYNIYGNNKYLYHVSLRCILLKNREHWTFYEHFTEYLGIGRYI